MMRATFVRNLCEPSTFSQRERRDNKRENELKQCCKKVAIFHAYFFMMCTLHQNIPLYVFFSNYVLQFKQYFMKVFTIFFLILSLIFFLQDILLAKDLIHTIHL